jgi:hypothetical protein
MATTATSMKTRQAIPEERALTTNVIDYVQAGKTGENNMINHPSHWLDQSKGAQMECHD